MSLVYFAYTKDQYLILKTKKELWDEACDAKAVMEQSVDRQIMGIRTLTLGILRC